MTGKFCCLLVAWLLFAPTKHLFAQQRFILTVADSAAIAYVDTTGIINPVTFADPGVDGLIHSATITTFKQLAPFSNYEHTRHLWRIEGVDSAFMDQLRLFYPRLFPAYRLETEPVSLAYYPSDWSGPGYSSVNYLDFIGAPMAWDTSYGCQGDANTLIGITDTWFDMTNNDFQGKIAHIGPNVFRNDGNDYHGTHVASVAGARTNNGYLLPSIGFKCNLSLSSDRSSVEFLRLAQLPGTGHVRVTNGSWLNLPTTPSDAIPQIQDQVIYDELYEAGITACFGAGNGRPNVEINNTNFAWPASYDHNISVTSVAHTGTTGTAARKYAHEFGTLGDSAKYTHQHNSKVDICAPGIAVSCAQWVNPNGTDTVHNLTLGEGTSYSSPIVAGTCGLMYSANPCLTPYQVEWLLKKNAFDLYRYPFDGNYDNFKYYGTNDYNGRLGAGMIQADQAVHAAKLLECNDPNTQTLIIESVTTTHLCAPNTMNNVPRPKFKVVVKNGTPPYRYEWTALDGNTGYLDNYQTANPGIWQYNPDGYVHYRLAIYDASEIQQVASRVVKLKLINEPVSDLAMRDSHYDMLDQPNSQYEVNHLYDDFWHSPDLWNRDTADGRLFHEDPQYFSSGNPNYIYVRVRNMGCVPNQPDAAMLHVYWTNSSTGEKWADDWNGTTQLPSSGGSLPLTIPGGGEITSNGMATPIIPALIPGDSVIIAIPWNPVKPENFSDSSSHIDVCVLARIIENNLPDSGIVFPEVTRTTSNMYRNNNICTRNFNVINLGRSCAGCRVMSNAYTSKSSHRVYVANADATDKTFTIQMLTQKDKEKHLAGSIADYVYVTVHLGNLFERWQAGGSKGSYASVDQEAKTVIYDPSSPMLLEGIVLHPDEHFALKLDFVLRSGISIPFDVNDFKVYIRQLLWENNKYELYGAVAYNLNIAATANGAKRPAATSLAEEKPASTPALYTVYPNPTAGIVNVLYKGSADTKAGFRITDLSGKLILGREDIVLKPGDSFPVRLTSLPGGVYFIRVADSAGIDEIQTLLKQ